MKQLVLFGLFLGSIAFGANQPAVPCDPTDNIVVNGIQYINVACNANCNGSSGACSGKNTGGRCSVNGVAGLCEDHNGDGQCSCDTVTAQPVDPMDPGAGF